MAAHTTRQLTSIVREFSNQRQGFRYEAARINRRHVNVMDPDDSEPTASPERLHEQALKHLGRRLFAEARQQSESEDAEFEARLRERRKIQNNGAGAASESVNERASEATE